MRKAATKLDMIASAKLINLIEAEYVESGLDDAGFAAHATEKLGFLVVESHVQRRRANMGLATPRDRNAASADATVLARLAEIERNGAALAEVVSESVRRIDLIIKVLNLKKHFEGGI